jgi:GNAT superfamily N-acetyltransferase
VKIIPLNQDLTDQTRHLMTLGAPYISARTPSDYWHYARLFSPTCPVAVIGGRVVGAVIAFRSQDDPREVYVQDVITHPEHRGQGIARDLLQAVRDRAASWRCARIYLTSEPGNAAGHAAWISMGFVNVPGGDYSVDGVQVTAGFKGSGKDRAVYELTLA